MKVKDLWFVGALMLLCSFSALAQNTPDKKVASSEKKSNKEKKEETQNAEIKRLKEACHAYGKEVDSLQSVITVKELTIKDANDLLDSLRNEIKAKDKELTALQERQAYVDTILYKTINRYLTEPYNKKNITAGKLYWTKIYSSEIKHEWASSKELLDQYENYYRQFNSILKNAQEDSKRNSPFVYEEYKNKYIQQIKSMPYYNEYYNKWYRLKDLDTRIEKALSMLEKHSPNNYASFIELIDYEVLE